MNIDTETAEIPHRIRAFMRHIERHLTPRSPSFALVVLDEDGAAYHLIKANRTGLVVAATGLMFEALDQEKQGYCICPTCDRWTAQARQALEAMGHTLPGAGAN